MNEVDYIPLNMIYQPHWTSGLVEIFPHFVIPDLIGNPVQLKCRVSNPTAPFCFPEPNYVGWAQPTVPGEVETAVEILNEANVQESWGPQTEILLAFSQNVHQPNPAWIIIPEIRFIASMGGRSLPTFQPPVVQAPLPMPQFPRPLRERAEGTLLR